MKKILITGGSGFIGKNLIEYIDKNCSNNYEIYSPSSRELDITDEVSVDRWLDGKYYDIVCHFGLYSAYNHAGRDADKQFEYNLRSYELFEKYHDNYGRLFYAGSGAEYDKRFNIVKVKEEDAGKTIPTDWYGLAKYIIGQRIDKSDNIYNLRIFGIFGKYEYYPSKFISGLCAKAVMGLPFTIRQDVVFDYLWIDDFCRMLILLFESSELRYHTYNLVSGTEIRLSELCDIVSDIAEKKQQIYICKEGIGKEYTASNERFINEFPDFKYTKLQEAIADLYKWYLEYKEGIEIEKLLYQ